MNTKIKIDWGNDEDDDEDIKAYDSDEEFPYEIPGYEKLEEVVGRGAFGVVRKTRNIKTGEICCTKVMKKKGLRKNLKKNT